MTEENGFAEHVSGVGTLDGSPLDGSAPARRSNGPVVTVDIARLHPHPDNIRDDLGDLAELTASIESGGILHALLISPHPAKAGDFHVVDGHRRLAAAKAAGQRDIPVVVRQTAIGISEVMRIMLVTNLYNARLGPVEKARAMGRMRAEGGMTGVQIARALGLSDATVNGYLALLDLDGQTQKLVQSGTVPLRDAIRHVRKERARKARSRGHTDRRAAAAATWEPDHFTRSHPLARKAAGMCDVRAHSARRRIGSIACGQCWETVIRRDEQLVIQATDGTARKEDHA